MHRLLIDLFCSFTQRFMCKWVEPSTRVIALHINGCGTGKVSYVAVGCNQLEWLSIGIIKINKWNG